MTKKEFAILAAAIKTYYPKEKILPNDEAMSLWYKHLQDIPFQVAEASLDKWVAINKWSPSISDLRETAVSVVQGEKQLWSDGWELTCRMIRKYGSYNKGKALSEMDEITRQTVERLGYMQLCQSENIMADRANFRVVFEQIADRKHKEAQLNPTLRQLVATIQRKELEDESKRLSASNPQD